MRKVRILLASAMVLAVLGQVHASGTGDVQAKSAELGKEPVELVVSMISGPVAAKMKDDAKAFSVVHPNVTFKFMEFESKTYEEQGPRLFMSKDKPDVAWYWFTKRTLSVVEAGAFEPIDDVYVKAGLASALPKSTIDLYTFKDGKKYGVNDTIVWAPVMYYNKKAFRAAGAEAPKTMEEFYAIAPALRKAGYIPLVSGVGFGNIAGHVYEGVLSHTVTADQYAKLLDFSKKYDDITYDSPAFVAVFEQLKRMGKELFPEGVAGIQDNEARGLFVQGKAAVYSSGSWAAGSALLGKELAADFELGTMYYPRMTAGVSGAVGLFPGNAVWVIKGTGKEAWAKEFVAYGMSKERHVALAASKALFPSRTDLTAADLAPLGEIQINMYRQMQERGNHTLWHAFAPVDLNQIKNEVVQSVVAGSMQPAEAGKKMQQSFEATLKN